RLRRPPAALTRFASLASPSCPLPQAGEGTATAAVDSSHQRLEAHARRRGHVVRHEEVHLQRLAWVGAVAVEVGHALAGEETVVDGEIAGEARWLLEDAPGGVGENVGLARHA